MITFSRALGVRVLIAWTSCWISVEAAEFHVSLTGDDANPGTLEQPWRSVSGAQTNLRVWRESQDQPTSDTVFIHGGIYELAEPWHLTEEDSGTADAPVRFVAYDGESVQLVGGKQVRTFARVNDPQTLAWFDEAAREHLLVADLKAAGITNFGTWQRSGYDLPMSPAPLELFHAAGECRLASWPNGDAWATLDAVRGDAAKPLGELTAKQTAPHRWASTQDVWIHGFWETDWSDTYERVASTQDGAVAIDLADSATPVRRGARVRIVNAREELDSEGEWYLDRETGKLYAWLPGGAQDDATAIVSLLDTPVSIYGARYVQLEGLTIASARVSGIEVAGGEGVVLKDCHVHHCGNVGVHIYHGQRHQLITCEIDHSGHTAVRVEGGDRATLTACHHLVSRNHIHHFGRLWHGQTCGVEISGVGITVAQNRIEDGPNAGVIIVGNDHDIAYNEVARVAQVTDDVGGIYLAHNPTYRGNLIRHNYLHDLGGFTQTGVIAIYLDDFASDTRVVGNVCRNTGRGIAIGGGRDNIVDSNVVLGCAAGIQVDSRGETWASDWFAGPPSDFWSCVYADDVNLEVYESHYPGLRTLQSDQPARAKHNTVQRNLICGPHALEVHDGLSLEEINLDGNVAGGAESELEVTESEVRLRPDSSLIPADFQSLDWRQLGPEGAPLPLSHSRGE